ncbi:Anoctamin-5 [Podila humilis]|nr:Anoctamin-5 [Podila humilis]
MSSTASGDPTPEENAVHINQPATQPQYPAPVHVGPGTSQRASTTSPSSVPVSSTRAASILQSAFLSPHQNNSRIRHTSQPNLERVGIASQPRAPSASVPFNIPPRHGQFDGIVQGPVHVNISPGANNRVASSSTSWPKDSSTHSSKLTVATSPTSDSESRTSRRPFKDEGGQLSPRLRHRHQHQRQGAASTPPMTPSQSSLRSRCSRRSSRRRSGGLHSDTTAAEQLANDQNLNVITRRMSSYRVVQLLYQTDADLFDAIQEWKEGHPDCWVDDAIDAFASAKGSDALAQLVYSTEAFDMILKYIAHHADIASLFDQQPKNDRSHRSPSQRSEKNTDTSREHSKTVIRETETIWPSTAPLPSAPVFEDARSRTAPVASDSHPYQSRLSHLRHSSSDLLSRAFSLGSSRHRSNKGAKENKRTALGHIHSHSLPHITVDISTPGDHSTAPQPLQSFQPLGPLDCSTDLFPSQRTPVLDPNDLWTQKMANDSMATAAVNHVPASACQLLHSKDGENSDDSSYQNCQSLQHQLQPSQQQQQLPLFQPPSPPPPLHGNNQQYHGLRRRASKPSKAKLREWKIQLHRRDYQLALLKQGVFIELEKSIDSKAVYVKVLAPFWRLEDEAQKTSCKADLADSMLPSIPYASRIFPSFSRLFPCLVQPGLEQRREAALFKTSRLTDYHLAEPGRRWSDVVRHAGAINRDGLHVGTNCGIDGRPGFFQTSRRGYLVRINYLQNVYVNSIMMRTDSRNSTYGRKMGLRSALRRGAYQKLFPLHDGSFRKDGRSTHDANYRAQLRVKWAKRWWRSQPLDLVNAYFGERIGVYFAWLGHYTKWLTIPATVGIAVFVFGVINAARLNKLDATPNALFAIFDNALTMPFALFMSIWSTVYIEFWKRANQYYAYRWNMIDYERVELPRTEFKATRVRYSAVTGRKELYYPMYWKAVRIMASSAAVFLAVCVVVGSVASLMIFKAWCRNNLTGPYAAVVATAMLNLIIIIILGEIWCRLAEWLTEKENHKYTDSYEDSLIIKRYLFDFCNMYGTLFYYAFFKAPFGRKIFIHNPDLQDECLYDACITELTVQLAVVFIGKQFLNGLFEMVFPWIERTWNRKKILADQALKSREYLDRRKWLRAPEWVKDDDLPSYQGRILKCYRKAVIQFGFCTLFVTSFPVAPAFALINNWIDIRMEANRILTQYQRPIAFRAQDIGMWEKIMEFVSFTSVITNAAIIAFSSLWIKQNLFVKYLHADEDGDLLAARLGFILVFENVVFIFKIILRASIPSVPLTIKLAVQRSKHLNQVAMDGRESELDEDLDMYSSSESEFEETYGQDEDLTDEVELNQNENLYGPELMRVHSDVPPHGGRGGGSVRGVSLQDNKVAASSKSPTRKGSNTWSPFGIFRRRAPTVATTVVSETQIYDSQQNPNTSPHEHYSQENNLSTIVENPDSAPSSRGKVVAAEERVRSQANIPQLHSQPQQHQPPSSQQNEVLQNRYLGYRGSLNRPTPYRSNTEMDGEWVVLDEPRM